MTGKVLKYLGFCYVLLIVFQTRAKCQSFLGQDDANLTRKELIGINEALDDPYQSVQRMAITALLSKGWELDSFPKMETRLKDLWNSSGISKNDLAKIILSQRKFDEQFRESILNNLWNFVELEGSLSYEQQLGLAEIVKDQELTADFINNLVDKLTTSSQEVKIRAFLFLTKIDLSKEERDLYFNWAKRELENDDNNLELIAGILRSLGQIESIPDSLLITITSLISPNRTIATIFEAEQLLIKQKRLPLECIEKILEANDAHKYMALFSGKLIAANFEETNKNLDDYCNFITEISDNHSWFFLEMLNDLSQYLTLSENCMLKATKYLSRDIDPRLRQRAVEIIRNQEKISTKIFKNLYDLFVSFDEDLLWGNDEEEKILVEALAKHIQYRPDQLFEFINGLLTNKSEKVLEEDGKEAKILNSISRLPDKCINLIKDKLINSKDYTTKYNSALILSQQNNNSEFISLIEPYLADSSGSIRSIAINIIGKIDKDYFVRHPGLYKVYLKDSNSVVKEAILNQLSDNVLSEKEIRIIIGLYEDSSLKVVDAVTNILLNQNNLSPYVIEKLDSLLPAIPYKATSSFVFLFKNEPIKYKYKLLPILSGLIQEGDLDKSKVRFYLHTYGEANDTIEHLLRWVCLPKDNPSPNEVDINEARNVLTLLTKYLEWDKNQILTHKARNEIYQSAIYIMSNRRIYWEASDIPLLKKARYYIQESKLPYVDIPDTRISQIEKKKWIPKVSMIIGIHFVFWIILIIGYPYIQTIRTVFFWNPFIRKWLGIYISFFIIRIPFLRNRIFGLYKGMLISEIYTGDWQEIGYFPKSKVYAKKKKRAMSIQKALIPLNGKNILEGESGLGKSMFLRNMAIHTSRVVVYLPATRCTQGIVPAIQQKLPITANDPGWLKKLIYAGAMDILIDGLNEISSSARTQIKLEVERDIKGKILITTQPMEWEPPVAAKQFVLQPLAEKQVEAFLLSRYPYLEQKELIPESAFQDHSKVYLKAAFDSQLDAESLKSNRHILSNPMDLTLVAQLIARGEKPSLLDLQQQQYELMAKDYKLKNMQQDFPLARFSSQVYQIRIDDQAEIPHQGFEAAMIAMQKWKMVVSRITHEGDQHVTSWYFRHDKIMDYFLVQEFLRREDLTEKHLDDPRFRGVYFLLAYKLDYEDAMKLRERLIQHAADSKDHSLSDNFIMLLRGKKPPRVEELKLFREKIGQMIAQGDYEKAIQLIRSKINGQDKAEAVLLENRNTELEKEIIQGVISPTDAQLRRNQLNKAILDFVRGME